MKRQRTLVALWVLALTLVGVTGLSQAQGPEPQGGGSPAMGTAFTYQGRLVDGGSPAEGAHDLEFKLYDAESEGSQVGAAVVLDDVAVSDGYFTVALDFGAGAFNGDARWLEIGVRPGNSTGAYTALSPRQALRPAPYAIYAGAGPAGNGWSLTGNSGTSPGTHFLGTTDDQALELWVGNERALRLEPDGVDILIAPNVIGGYSGNGVADGVEGATIGGGGYLLRLGADITETNQVIGGWGTIGGGSGNIAGERAIVAGGYRNHAVGQGSAIGGGFDNRAHGARAMVGGGWDNNATHEVATIGGGRRNRASSLYATIGGGELNVVSGTHGTIAGGQENTVNSVLSTIGGGQENVISGTHGTIGGGYQNTARGPYITIGGGRLHTAVGQHATVGGGYFHEANGAYATIAGGDNHWASGDWATVPGGRDNHATGDYSFAAGRQARAVDDGSFVWADSTEADLASTAENQFLVRANGGAVFTGTNNSTAMLHVTNLGSAPGIEGHGGSHGVVGYGNIGTYGSGSSYGVYGTSANIGVYGTGLSRGVYGYSPGTGVGVYARSDSGNPIEAYSSASDRELYLTNSGDLYIDGTFNPGGADFAEMLPAAEGLEPGDVLVIGADGQLARSTQAHQPTVAGVYSTQPGILGGAGEGAAGALDPPGKVPLAVVGVVPVKASAENGAIRPGDLLAASDTPGHAMVAGPHPALGTVIGKALQGLEQGHGVIQMLVVLQ